MKIIARSVQIIPLLQRKSREAEGKISQALKSKAILELIYTSPEIKDFNTFYAVKF